MIKVEKKIAHRKFSFSRQHASSALVLCEVSQFAFFYLVFVIFWDYAELKERYSHSQRFKLIFSLQIAFLIAQSSVGFLLFLLLL